MSNKHLRHMGTGFVMTAIVVIGVVMSGNTSGAPGIVIAEKPVIPKVSPPPVVQAKPEATIIPKSTSKIPSESTLGVATEATPFWQHDFTISNSPTPDPAVWHYELNPDVPGYNNEQQAYTNRLENVRIVPGNGLIIEARKESYQYSGDTQKRSFNYTSGRIDTRKSFSFEYGKIEASIKLPRGAGSWPAFWLLSANQVHTSKLNPTDADWQRPRFYAKDGELDIVEHYGRLPGVIEGTAHTYFNAHEGSTIVDDYDKTFHVYGIEIKPEVVVWSVDGKPFHRWTKTSNDPDSWPVGNGNKFYPILNLAMGGSGGGAIDDTIGPWRMEVQWLRYYSN